MPYMYSTTMPHILMNATIQARLQLDATILHSYLLLVFAIHALTATNICNRNIYMPTESEDGCYNTGHDPTYSVHL